METAIEKQEEKALQIQTPSDFIMKALESNASIEQLERLMQLKERWDANQAKAAFLHALSKFQSEVPEILKEKGVGFESKTGGTVDYKYATLGLIEKKIKSCLYANGLSKNWKIEDKEGKLSVTCIISHVQGHSESTTMIADADDSGKKNKIQSRGSTVTYLQRYTLISALGLSTADVDTDGKEKKKPTAPIGDARFDKIVQGIKSSKVTVDEIIAIEANKNNEFTEDQIKKLRDIEDNKS